jgi:chromosomal replication initiator protein
VQELAGGLWRRFLETLQTEQVPRGLHGLMASMRCLEADESRVVVGLRDSFAVDMVNGYYRDLLEAALARVAPGTKLSLEVTPEDAVEEPLPVPELIEDAPEPIAATVPSSLPAPRPSSLPTRAAQGPAGPRMIPTTPPRGRSSQLPQAATGLQRTLPASPTPMNDRYTFETFVTGPSNQLAAAAAQSVADNPGRAYNPLFVFGRVGLGKTHLAQAIGHNVLRRNPQAVVHYQTTEQFVNDVVEGIRFERMGDVRRTYRECDLLIIDDIQFISGKEACQNEFFHTFNALYDSRKQVVVTSDKLPNEIPGLEERIRSRFQWGLIVDLQPPELETRLAIVRKKAETDGLALSDDVAMFIADAVRSNVRELEGCLIRIGAYATLTRRPVTVDLAQAVLRDVLQQRPVLTPDAIVRTVAAHFDVKVVDLKSKRRGKSIALPRQVAMYLIRKHLSCSYPEIGEALGGKDHTTALNAMRTIEARLPKEPALRQAVDELERQLSL